MRDLIEKGEVFVTKVDGKVFAGHRSMSQAWTSGHDTVTEVSKVGSSAAVTTFALLCYMFLSSLGLNIVYLSS